MGDYLRAGDNVGANVGAIQNMGEVVMCPRMDMKYAVGVPDGQGGYIKVAEGTGANAVMTEGRRWVMNRIFYGNTSGTTAGAGLFLHSYTSGAPGTSMGWSNVSASQVTIRTDTAMVSFAMGASTNDTAMSFTTQYTVSGVANATVYGAGVIFYTSAAVHTSAQSANVILYNVGTFANSQALASNNVLSVTVNFGFA